MNQIRPDLRDMQFIELINIIYLDHLDPRKKNFQYNAIKLIAAKHPGNKPLISGKYL